MTKLITQQLPVQMVQVIQQLTQTLKVKFSSFLHFDKFTKGKQLINSFQKSGNQKCKNIFCRSGSQVNTSRGRLCEQHSSRNNPLY